MLDNNEKTDYIPRAVIVDIVKETISALHLDNVIEENNDLQRGDQMPSAFRQTYYYEDTTLHLSGKTKKDTDLKFRKYVEEHYVKSDSKQSDITVDEFINTVYRESFIKNLSPNCISNYEIYIKQYISPYLGSFKLVDVTVADIQRFMDYLANGKEHGFKTDIANKSIDRICGLLSRIFRVAQEMNIIKDTPFKKTLLHNNGKQSKHHKALPDDVVSKVKANIPMLKNVRERLYMAILVYTGLRKEEILGLRWENIYFDKQYGQVCFTVTYPDKSKPVFSNRCKTEYSKRTFVLPNALIEILKPLSKESGFIVCGDNQNTPPSHATFQRMYRHAFKELGIEAYNNHDWRATYATQLKEIGLTSAQVADAMGHADTRMVETVYAPSRHEGIMKNKDAIEKLNKEYSVVPD